MAGLGLQFDIERQYYSPQIPEGRIMSQLPLPGTKVRRGWQVRVAQSLGPQRVAIPDVTKESERAAELNIRRRGLDVASTAQMQLAGSARRSGAGAEPSGQRQPGGGAEDQPAREPGRCSAGVCDAELYGSAAGHGKPHPAGCGLQAGHGQCSPAAEFSWAGRSRVPAATSFSRQHRRLAVAAKGQKVRRAPW